MSLNAIATSDVGQRHLLSKGKVLVVHEDRANLAYYRTVLQRAGWLVVDCPSYREAMRCLGSGGFDLVVLNQGSRAFEGRPVLERAVEVNRKRPVLVVTRSLDMGCYLDAMHLGATDYLEEPVSEMEMARVAENYFHARSAAA
jgi:DNA-binding NtrC family response regulator